MTEEDIFRENAAFLNGIEDAPPIGRIPVPDHALFVLERTRRQVLAAREKKIARPPFSVWLLRIAAAFLLLAALGWFFFPRNTKTPRVARVVITSPGDTIASTRPTIAWTSKDAPGQRYDVWILPANGDHLKVPALYKAENVISPVQFANFRSGKENPEPELQPGGSYQVLVCLAGSGRMAGVPVPFKITALQK